MKKSLSTRLMYSFMTVIVVIVVGITAGISYLVADYFFKNKEQELAQRGKEVAESIEYFIRSDDLDTLYSYIIAADKLVGARIWLFDDGYELLVASYRESSEANVVESSILAFFHGTETIHGRVHLDSQLKGQEPSDRVKLILRDIYDGKSHRSQIFHPYYKEQVILVGVPYQNPLTKRTGAILMTEPLSGFEKFLRNIYTYIIATGLLALVVSLCLVKRLSNTIIRPLVQMKNQAAVMASGDYSQRIAVQGKDEVAELSQALNSLGSDLDTYVKKMERTEKIRRDFVANVSHELRTPITIIRGYNEAICDGIVTDPELIARYRNLINEETVRLERMVRELLDISRFQASDELPANKLEPIPLAALVRNVAEKLMVRDTAKGVKFSIHVDENIKILGNGDQLVQLVLILSDNALKYSPENGTVSLGAKKLEDGAVIFAVRDDGPGIPAQDIPFIWERFYKVDKSHSRNVPGTGLGLAIAKEIIRMHGASAEVTSKCGVGTTFEIKFPKDKVV